jgi:hypothetical protein
MEPALSIMPAGMGLTFDAVPDSGTVMSIRGAVVDVPFANGALAPIQTALMVNLDRSAPLVLEVHNPFDTHTVRGTAIMAEQESWSAPPGLVLYAISSGWALKGLLLRPANVVVAKAPSASNGARQSYSL